MHKPTIAALLIVLLACAARETPETMTPPTYEVRTTRTFDAPIERVFGAWTDAEDVKAFWGPRGFTAPIAELDVREAGTSFVCMQAPPEMGGALLCNTWTYSRIVAPERIEFTLHFTDAERNRIDPATMPGMPPGIPNGVPHVLTLRDLGDNRTELTLVESGYTTPQARDISAAGLQQVLDKLAERLSLR